MRVFVDTSVFYSATAPEDGRHSEARAILERVRDEQLVTTNYVLLECASLLQRRHGFSPAKVFLAGAHETLEIIWVDEPLHRAAVSTWSKVQSRGLSLVDCTSFAAMRHAEIRRALAFDPHFSNHGFEVMP